MNAPFQPERPPEPLKVTNAEPTWLIDGTSVMMLSFNRSLTEGEVKAYEQLPPTPQMFLDVRSYAERLVLAELVARLFQFYFLGGIVLPDSPAAIDWLKSYLNGAGHGPLGHPLRWPGMVASAHNILVRWGFQPTEDGFVGKIAKAPAQAPG